VQARIEIYGSLLVGVKVAEAQAELMWWPMEVVVVEGVQILRLAAQRGVGASALFLDCSPLHVFSAAVPDE